MERTKIRFVAAIEPLNRVSAAVKAARLVRRFAVIQEMYRPDKAEDDRYFDEALWRGRRVASWDIASGVFALRNGRRCNGCAGSSLVVRGGRRRKHTALRKQVG